jgi:hypothetical protein
MRTHCRTIGQVFRARVQKSISRPTRRSNNAKKAKTIGAQRISAHGNMVRMLPDGIYDSFVVWAEMVTEDAMSMELTVTAGAHKGEVVSVRASHPTADPFALVGLPCRLIVEAGNPRVEFEARG